MIRKAHLDDIPAIHKLYSTLFDGMAALEPAYMKVAQQDTAFIESVIKGENDFIIFVAEDDKEVQGFAIAQLQSAPPYNCFVQQRLVYLLDLVVNPDSRGKGYGKKLIQTVKEWGVQNKVDYFELSVLSQNNKAIDLYLREGFETFNISMRMRLDDKAQNK
ncbi:GNAT family N-acetyltransferase [Myroides odoratimimus]|uniref:GNAT family N-acetyltransferase n=2 Tax=Myroides odoratimimus TaxID=76832 RepID=UPI00257882B3|nr:GNAT family N-acetyltransferase [Myroides odoratimimus]MDM1326699.1 GNAT family N-acetyltransferase [Myroides odoratimimus]